MLVCDSLQLVADDLGETEPPGPTADWEEDVIRYVHKEKDFIYLSSCTVGMSVFVILVCWDWARLRPLQNEPVFLKGKRPICYYYYYYFSDADFQAFHLLFVRTGEQLKKMYKSAR